MDRNKYDLVVIGGGPGGYVAAIRATQLGKKVALIEKNHLGGTCLNYGCIPTKTIVHGCEILNKIKKSEEWGITVNNVQMNPEKLIEKKNNVVNNLRSGVANLIKANKIDYYAGLGKIINANIISIITDENQIELSTENIIIATGSKQSYPPISGVDLPEVINSDEALNLTEIPENLVIIGAGVIGLEFACIYASLGSNVTVLEAFPTILPMVDEDISKRLIPIWKKQGIKIETAAKVNRIFKLNGRLIVSYQAKSNDCEISCDKVLVATGRKPNIIKEELIGLNIELDGDFIKVDKKMQTSVKNIYAIGDVINSQMLAHVASAEGIVAADNISGVNNEMRYDFIPSCIYTYPEIANVGLTEKQAKDNNIDVKVSKIPFSSNGRAQTLDESMGMIKLVLNKNTHQLIGAHIFGSMASELIAEITLAMNSSLTIKGIAHTIHSHPSLSELIHEGAHALLGSPIHTI